MENAMAHQHLEDADIPYGSMIIMDRFYVDNHLLQHILDKGLHLCVRLKSNLRIVKEFNKRGVNDAVLPFKLMKDRIGNARMMRVVRFRINKATYLLMTDLLDPETASLMDLADLYHQRWEVEESYKIKKCRIKIEEVRVLTPELVRQEFHAKIFAECLTAAMALELEPEVRSYKDRCTDEYKICLTQVLAKMKISLILLFLRPRIDSIVERLSRLFLKSLVACEPGRKFKRRHPGKNARKIQTNSVGYTYNR